MTAVARRGTLARSQPQPGTRARSRDLGYADAMDEIAILVRDLQGTLGTTPDEVANPALIPIRAILMLDQIGSYAADASLMVTNSRITVGDLGRLGRWEHEIGAHNCAPGSRGCAAT